MVSIAIALFMLASMTCIERPVSASMPPYLIVYVYKNDLATANNFRSFLHDENYFQVNLVNMSLMGSINFNLYSVVILGEDTGLPSVSFAWTNSTAVSKINNSIAKIVGIGDGGTMFYHRLGLGIGYPNNMGDGQNSTVLLASFPSAFPGPYTITPGNKVISITNPGEEEIYYSGALPANTTGFSTAIGDPYHYPIIRETARYLLWGFTCTPDQMTEDAKELFVNIISSMVNNGHLLVSHPPDISYPKGQSGNNIVWDMTDIWPNSANMNCSIYKDSVWKYNSSWTSGTPVIYSVDGISPGWYRFEIRARDGLNGWVSDTVMVTVTGGQLGFTHPADIDYVQSQTGNTITWTITESNSGPSRNYSIYQDAVLKATGSWTSGVSIVYNIDGLAVGNHVIELIAQDGSIATGNDSVTVTVEPLPPAILASNPMVLFMLSGVAVMLVIMVKKDKMQEA